MTDQALLDCVADLGRQLPAGGAAELASAVMKAGGPERLLARADGLPTGIQRKGATRLAKLWDPTVISAEGVAVGLQSAQLAGEIERSAQTVELVWTGPKTQQVAVSMNAEALNEVVAGAQEHLLVVSYATYQMPELVESLGEAVERGVGIDMVLEFHGSVADQPSDWDPVAGLGGVLNDRIRVYEWPIDQREQTAWGKVGYLHVKCAVADERHAFVSSANLTVYAMEMNMELGVVIRGGDIPGRIARHFRSLIDDGILQRVEA